MFRQTIFICLLSRSLLLLWIALFHFLLPDFNAGDDVLTFSLRSHHSSPNDESTSSTTHCFCLEGHACDHAAFPNTGDARWKLNDINSERLLEKRYDSSNPTCASDQIIKGDRYEKVDQLYDFILSPFTKWDAARFLSLAVDPLARYPPSTAIMRMPTDNINYNDRTTHSCQHDNNHESCQNHPSLLDYTRSEEAHAFLPLVPLILRYGALWLMGVIPSSYLPSTYEGVVILTGLLWNCLCVSVAATSLFRLTFGLICSSERELSSKERQEGSHEMNEDVMYAQRLAYITAIMYCLNPADVFFITCYSEATFSCLTFLGYYLWFESQKRFESVYHGTYDKAQRFSICVGCVYWFLACISLTLASYARYNGTLSSIFIIIMLVSNVLVVWRSRHDLRGEQQRNLYGLMTQVVFTVIVHITSAIVVTAPALYHDQRGAAFHCDHAGTMKPEWCDIVKNQSNKEDSSHRHFSLYAYVQRTHWNVGFLKYYELKQIPNFILATPILFLGTIAVCNWIYNSWRYHCKEYTSHEGNEKVYSLNNIFRWACQTLVDSVKGPNLTVISEGGKTDSKDPKADTITVEEALGWLKTIRRDKYPKDKILRMLGSNMLAHYAMLAGFCIIGTVLAHVQISTRMICSSCPAIFWFMAACVQNADEKHDEKNRNIAMKFRWLICGYIMLYHFLGVVMHFNSLPWT